MSTVFISTYLFRDDVPVLFPPTHAAIWSLVILAMFLDDDVDDDNHDDGDDDGRGH